MATNGQAASRNFDLDAARVARAETRGEPPTVTVGGKTYQLTPTLPWDYFELVDAGEAKEALRLVFADQFDAFWKGGIDTDDVMDLARGIPRLYGFANLGESSASAGSSPSTGSRSRPTSPASTRSTSAKRSTARRRSG